MDETTARIEICETGLELLKTGLVARTWGNVSCRADAGHFLITPSGLDYTRTKPEDIVRMKLETMESEGLHKPSSEKGIHAAAYEIFDDVDFVIHTHQSCATALGLAGWDSMDISSGELERLGGLARANYGLPGTKPLKNAVRAAMLGGAKAVFMANHGVLICGSSREDAMEKVQLLEDICRRNLKGQPQAPERAGAEETHAFLAAVRKACPNALSADSDSAAACADLGLPLVAQLDDMAQMIGRRIDCLPMDAERVITGLKKRDAVLVSGVGAVVNAAQPDDAQALKILVDKAAVSALHTGALGVKAQLSGFDAALMRFVYLKKYSKQKG